MVEKIATRKGERSVNVISKRERKVPKQDLEGLEAVFGTEAGSRHSIAIGELDQLVLSVELPTKSSKNYSVKLTPTQKSLKNGFQMNSSQGICSSLVSF